MHYWQHDALPSDDARLAAIAGLSVAQWRRIREPVQAKFSDGWRHKRIEAEIAKVDRALMQRRLAGRSGGLKSGIVRAVAQGEAIIRAQALGKRALRRNPSGRETGGQAGDEQPRTNHNHRFIPSSSSRAIPPEAAAHIDKGRAAHARAGAAGKPADHKPANQWSRQELDALFARRTVTGSADAPASASLAPPDAAPANPETGD
jgi:hypothetical protein